MWTNSVETKSSDMRLAGRACPKCGEKSPRRPPYAEAAGTMWFRCTRCHYMWTEARTK